MNVALRNATLKDIDSLIELRITFLQAEFGVLKGAKLDDLKHYSREYYNKAIPEGNFIGILAEDEDKVVGCAFLAITHRPPNEAWPNSRVGSILNVYTKEDYRHQGIGTRMMQALIQQAKQKDISYLELTASVAGKPIYEKLGFEVSSYPLMTMILQKK